MGLPIDTTSLRTSAAGLAEAVLHKQTGAPQSGSAGGAGHAVLSVTEAAQVLGISRSHAYDLVARGDLPSIRLGRRVLIPATALGRILSPESGERLCPCHSRSSAAPSDSATGASRDSTAWA